jgi:hypothetical protein
MHYQREQDWEKKDGKNWNIWIIESLNHSFIKSFTAVMKINTSMLFACLISCNIQYSILHQSPYHVIPTSNLISGISIQVGTIGWIFLSCSISFFLLYNVLLINNTPFSFLEKMLLETEYWAEMYYVLLYGTRYSTTVHYHLATVDRAKLLLPAVLLYIQCANNNSSRERYIPYILQYLVLQSELVYRRTLRRSAIISVIYFFSIHSIQSQQ